MDKTSKNLLNDLYGVFVGALILLATFVTMIAVPVALAMMGVGDRICVGVMIVIGLTGLAASLKSLFER